MFQRIEPGPFSRLHTLAQRAPGGIQRRREGCSTLKLYPAVARWAGCRRPRGGHAGRPSGEVHQEVRAVLQLREPRDAHPHQERQHLSQVQGAGLLPLLCRPPSRSAASCCIRRLSAILRHMLNIFQICKFRALIALSLIARRSSNCRSPVASSCEFSVCLVAAVASVHDPAMLAAF